MPRTAHADEDVAATTELRSAFEKRYRELVQHVAQTAPAETLARALASNDPFSGLAGALGSAMTLTPPRDPLAAARARSVTARTRLLQRAGGVLRVGEVAACLGVSTQAVQARRARGTLLALPQANGEHVYPAFQVEQAGVLAGFPTCSGRSKTSTRGRSSPYCSLLPDDSVAVVPSICCAREIWRVRFGS